MFKKIKNKIILNQISKYENKLLKYIEENQDEVINYLKISVNKICDLIKKIIDK